MNGPPAAAPAGPSAPRRQPFTPMLLSALVCPGAGQFMQRRWAPAVFFMTAFTASFVWFTVRVLATLKAYYEFAFNFSGASGESPGLVGIAMPFGLCLLLYVAGLIDTALGSRPARRTGDRSGS